MKVLIRSQPVFDIPITPIELGILKRMSESHYDGHCNSISRVGGFLYGWTNHQEFLAEIDAPEDQYRVTATWSQVDTLLKCLEMRRYLHSDDEREIALRLSRQLFKLLQVASESIGAWSREVNLEGS